MLPVPVQTKYVVWSVGVYAHSLLAAFLTGESLILFPPYTYATSVSSIKGGRGGWWGLTSTLIGALVASDNNLPVIDL